MGLGILNLNPNNRIRNTTAEIITESMANASFLLKSVCTCGVMHFTKQDSIIIVITMKIRLQNGQCYLGFINRQTLNFEH